MSASSGAGVAGRGETPLAVDARHPAFEGHFPGRPILPGVVLLAEAMAVLESLAARPPEGWTLASVKFPSSALPGEPLVMAHERLASGAVRWEIRAAGRVVAAGLAAPRDPGPRPP